MVNDFGKKYKFSIGLVTFKRKKVVYNVMIDVTEEMVL